MKDKNQKICDRLLSPLIKDLFPHCLLCGGETQVAHHFVHKSKSLALRYNLNNLIPLCSSCHFKLHQNEGYWSAKIIEIKGLRWFKAIEKKKNELLVGKKKIDYNKVYKKLTKKYE